MKIKKWMVLFACLVMLLSLSACSKENSDDQTDATEETAVATTEAKTYDFDAEGIAQKFVEDFTSNKFDALLSDYDYSDDMKAQFTKEAMEEISAQLKKAYGSFEGTYGIKVQTKETFVIVSIGANHVDKDLAYNVVFSYEGQVSGFNYQEISSVEDFFDSEIEGAIEKEVTFGTEDFPISGTLSIPASGKESYPVVVLVHGSGPNDRNESIYGNKPFKDIAEGLIKQDIAVLRYDKRTFTHLEKYNDPKIAAEFTIYDEVIDDAKAAVAFLKTERQIDSDKIYVAGHSLGGNQAPRIAENNDDVAGLIIMAGNVTPLQDLIIKQYEYLLGIDGSLSDSDKSQLDTIKKAADLISSDKLSLETSPNDTMGLPAKYWMDIRDYNPADLAKSLDIPLLILQGARDYQVSVDEFELWKKGLGDDATFKLYEDLNHLFMTGEGMSKPEEYTKAGSFDQTVIEDIANWINNQ
ncbi:MAG: alpha/beta fold hydrolase [Firmicutes bacterium]|nr:alpha/beta fold hydrolase [Bacillota bacterium]